MSNVPLKEDDLPFGVSFAVMRCPHCELVHIGMLDDDDYAIAEMALDDAEVLQFALQLLGIIYPSDRVEKLKMLVAQIDGTGEAKH